MSIIAYILIATFISSCAVSGYCSDDYSNNKKSGIETPGLSVAVMGGIPNSNVSTFTKGITSSKVRQGARMGDSVNAADGAVAGVKWEQHRPQENMGEQEVLDYQKVYKNAPINSKIKRKVVRKYDDEGNLIEPEDTSQ